MSTSVPVAAAATGSAVAQGAGLLPARGAATEPPAMPAAASRTESVRPVRASDPEAVHQTAQETRRMVESAVNRIQEFVQSMERNLSFSVDHSSGHSIVRVVDPTTREVVRQVPPQEIIEIARTLEYVNSVLVSKRA